MATLQLSLGDDDPWVIEQKIFNILKELLEPTSTLSTTSAAETLDSLFPRNRNEQDCPQSKPKEDPGSFLWYMWCLSYSGAADSSFRPGAGQTGRAGESTRRLFVEDADCFLPAWDTDYKLWQDLPLLGPTLRELCDGEFLHE